VYYENGQLRSETPYRDDKIEGIVKMYREDGSVQRVDIYKNGEKTEEKTYNKEGGLDAGR